MKRILNKKNLIFILLCMTLFFMMPVISYAESDSINAVLKETVAGWHSILKAISFVFMLILLLLIAIKGALSKTAVAKKRTGEMLADWLFSLIIILFIQNFMIFAIYANEGLVENFEKWGQVISGMEEGQEISLYESTISKAYEIKFIPGTIGMLLYMVIVYFTYRLAFIYLKRYVNVIVLILVAPIVTCVNAFKKVIFGKSSTLRRWTKEFIYNVFLQSIHAALYGGFVGLALKHSSETESFLGALLAIIFFALIIVITHIVRNIFNTFGGDTAISLAEKPDWLEVAEGAAFDSFKKARATDNDKSFTRNFYNNMAEKAKAATLAQLNEFKELPNNLKEKAVETYKNIPTTFSDITETVSGKNKTVTEEEIAIEAERLKRSKGLRKVILTVSDFKKNIKGKFKKIKGAIQYVKDIPKEVKKYIEEKKNKVEKYIQDLNKDVEVIKLIPSLLKDAKNLNLRVKVDPVTGKVEYDEKYKAIFDTDLDPSQIPEALRECIDLTLGNVTAAILIGKGFSSLLQCPKIAFCVLAEENYTDMVHPETPVEARRVIEGFKSAPDVDKSSEKPISKDKPKVKLKFKGFDNTCINRLERITEFSVSEAFAGIRTLKSVTKSVVEEKVTYRNIPTDGVIKYTGKRSSRVDTQSKLEILIAGWHKFKTDAQMARNINLLNQYERVVNGVSLTNLSPEMLKILENAGMIKRVEPKNGFEGGYIILTYKISEAVMQQRINEFLENNPENPLADKIIKLLEQNPNSDVVLKISDYIIQNPDSELASVIDNIIITEDGKLLQKINGFVYDGSQLNLSQLGEIKEDKIVQKIITEDGKIVEQIIDLQGNIITPAVDEDGNLIKFPIDENGLMVQTIVTPDGNLMKQILSKDGTFIQPIMIGATIDKTQDLGTIEGLISRVAPQDGLIQIIDKENKTIRVISPENESVEIIKDENGNIKIITSEGEIEIDNNSVVQIINSQTSMVQIIDLEENSLRTIIKPTVETFVTDIENVTGVITEIRPDSGIIQIIDSQSGEIREITPESNVIIEKLEDGTVKVIVEGNSKEERQEIIVSQESIIQVVNSKDSMMQVIDLEDNQLKTIIGTEALHTDLYIADVTGIITEVKPDSGIIQIIDSQSGEIREITPESNVVIEKLKDGTVKVIIEGTPEVERQEIIVSQDSTLQVVKPGESTMQVIDLEKKVLQTVIGTGTIQTDLNFENKTGTITQIDSSSGIVRVVDSEGNIQNLNFSEENVKVIKEDGMAKIIIENQSSGEKREIIVDPDYVIQLVKPDESTVDIIDLKNNVMETSVGETAMKILEEQGMVLSSTQRRSFNAPNETVRRNDLKNELTKIAHGVALNLETGDVKSVFDMPEVTDVLTVFAGEEVLSTNSKPDDISSTEYLNDLIGQLNFAPDKRTVNASMVESEVITRDLLSNMGELILAKAETEKSVDVKAMEFSTDEMKSILDNLGTSNSLEPINVTGYEGKLKDALDSVKYTFDLGSAAIERDIVAKTTEAIQNGEIQSAEDITTFLAGNDNFSDFTKSIHQLEGLPPADTSLNVLERFGNPDITMTEKTKLDMVTAAISSKPAGTSDGESSGRIDAELEVTDAVSMFEKIKREISVVAQNKRDDSGATLNNDVASMDTIESGYRTLEDVVSATGKDAESKAKQENEVRTAFEKIVEEVKNPGRISGENVGAKPTDPLLAALEQISTDYSDSKVTETVDEIMYSILGEGTTTFKKKEKAKRVAITSNKKDRSSRNSNNTVETKREIIKFTVTGAVNKTGTFDVEVGRRVRDVIMKEAGRFAENADKDAIKDKVDAVIDKNNTSIHVPELSEDALEERNRKKDSKTIECYIDGEVNSSGTKFIKIGHTVSDILKVANGWTDKADIKSITVNGNVVPLTYILHDGDVVNVPERNLERIMLTECANYMKAHKGITLEIILQEKKVRADIITQIKFKCSSIQFTDKEIDDKLIKLLEKEVKKTKMKIRQQANKVSQIDYVAQGAVPTDTTDLLTQIIEGIEKSKVIIGKNKEPRKKTNAQIAQDVIMDSMKGIVSSAVNRVKNNNPHEKKNGEEG